MIEELIGLFVVFVLATLIGFEVITKVPPTLHTPLMSGSNAVSGITIIGALIIAGHDQEGILPYLGLVAVIFAMINVVGGFLVTDRMLQMFKKKPVEKSEVQS
jgi:proton-translocating NAD(P)+ transhydrogenase subunit alpha